MKSYLGISVINYKTWSFTLNFLQSLRFLEKDNIDYHVVLSDNSENCDGKIPDYFEFSNTTVLRNEKNIGFGAAHNKAASLLNCKYFLVVNNDIEFTEDTDLGLLLVQVEKINNFGVCGVSHINGEGKEVSSAFLSYPSLSNIIREYIIKNYRNVVDFKLNDFLNVAHINGAFMLFNKKAFDDVGGFSRDFFLYFEDTDICYKLNQKGYKVLYTDKHLIKHSGGESAAKKDMMSNVFKSDYISYHKSMLIFLKKSHSFIYVLVIKYMLVVVFFIKSILFYFVGKENLKSKGYWRLWIEIVKS